jgi:2-dehydropantoate 2-reductase
MRVAIFGTGGVGGYFGGRLAAAGTDVTFIARGTHLTALQRDGLRIVSPKGDVHLPRVHAVRDARDAGPADIVFFTVKMYDADPSAASLAPLIGPETVVIPFQNGVEAVPILQKALAPGHVAGGTAYVAAVIDTPGVIRHTAMDTLFFGELDGRRSASSARIRSFLR